MTEFNNQVFDWIDQAASDTEQQLRIETIRSTIGQVLLTKYRDLTQEIEIASEALIDLGLINRQDRQEDLLITSRQYDQICQELSINKVLGSRLWSAMKRQTKVDNRWPGLFDDQERLNIRKLSILVESQQLYGHKIGVKSRYAAQLLVDHLLGLQDRDI